MISNFNRVLRLNSAEVWDVTVDFDVYRVIIMDEKRPSTLEDFFPDVVCEEDMRENIIKIHIYSEEKIKTAHIQILDYFSKSLTNHLALAHTVVRLYFHVANVDEALREFLKSTYQIDQIPWENHINFNQD